MMRRLFVATLVLAIVGVASLALAADGPTGTWKWTRKFGERTVDMTLKLKLEGDKLTGAMLGRDGRETAIQEAKFKDGTVSFKVVREREGRKFTTAYCGKVSGDTIKGKMEFEREGKKESVDWEAKRAKD